MVFHRKKMKFKEWLKLDASDADNDNEYIPAPRFSPTLVIQFLIETQRDPSSSRSHTAMHNSH